MAENNIDDISRLIIQGNSQEAKKAIEELNPQDLKKKDANGNSIMSQALKNGNMDVAAAICQKSSNSINQTDALGNEPLQTSSSDTRAAIAAVAMGANTERINAQGQTASEIAGDNKESKSIIDSHNTNWVEKVGGKDSKKRKNISEDRQDTSYVEEIKRRRLESIEVKTR